MFSDFLHFHQFCEMGFATFPSIICASLAWVTKIHKSERFRFVTFARLLQWIIFCDDQTLTAFIMLWQRNICDKNSRWIFEIHFFFFSFWNSIQYFLSRFYLIRWSLHSSLCENWMKDAISHREGDFRLNQWHSYFSGNSCAKSSNRINEWRIESKLSNSYRSIYALSFGINSNVSFGTNASLEPRILISMLEKVRNWENISLWQRIQFKVAIIILPPFFCFSKISIILIEILLSHQTSGKNADLNASDKFFIEKDWRRK